MKVRSQDNTLSFMDRYKALGVPYPDPRTMCKGPCEGLGVHAEDDPTNPAWQDAHSRAHGMGNVFRMIRTCRRQGDPWARAISYGLEELACDGWHFVPCLDCGGSGLREKSIS